MLNISKITEYSEAFNPENCSFQGGEAVNHPKASQCYQFTSNPRKKGAASTHKTIGAMVAALRKDRNHKGTFRLDCKGKNNQELVKQVALTDDLLYGYERGFHPVKTSNCD